jgi:hypothetical protein
MNRLNSQGYSNETDETHCSYQFTGIYKPIVVMDERVERKENEKDVEQILVLFQNSEKKTRNLQA